MRPTHHLGTASAMAAVMLLASTALAGPRQTDTPRGATMIHIHLVTAGKRLEARIEDTPAGRDFIRLLPIDLTLEDFHATEKVADLPRRLDVTDTPSHYAAQAGDITYYAPWGNLAIFYKPFPSARGLIRLGEIDGPVDVLRQEGEVPVRIERAEP